MPNNTLMATTIPALPPPEEGGARIGIGRSGDRGARWHMILPDASDLWARALAFQWGTHARLPIAVVAML